MLGVKHKWIVGYRGGNDVFLAMQRGEIHVHSTSITTFRGRNAAFVKSGDGVGIAYLVPVDDKGRYEISKFITEMPAFPDLSSRCTAGCRRGRCGTRELAHQPDR